MSSNANVQHDPLSLIGQLMTVIRPSKTEIKIAKEREREAKRRQQTSVKIQNKERMKKFRAKAKK